MSIPAESEASRAFRRDLRKRLADAADSDILAELIEEALAGYVNTRIADCLSAQNTSMNYALLLACFSSGQISDAQWQEHRRDDVFVEWLKRHGDFVAS